MENNLIEGKVENKFKSILAENKDIENFLMDNEGIIVFSKGDIHIIEGLQYGKTEIPWHAGKIKQVNITQNIRMN